MKWLEETHGTRFELVRHFLARMFDSELSSTPGHMQTLLVSALALFIPAGILLLEPLDTARYRALSNLPTPGPFRAAAVADELSLITLAFAFTGLLAMLQWQSLFPSRRDYMALASLPVRSSQIFAARLTAVLLLSTALVIAMNLLPSFTVPIMIQGRWQKNPSVLANGLAHGAASGLACFFVLFALIGLQGVLLNLLSQRLFARIAVYIQGLIMAVLFTVVITSRSIVDWTEETVAHLPDFGAWAPPVWFLGLHEVLLGDRNPFFRAMAGRALLFSAAAVSVALLTYLVSYHRYRKLLLESPAVVKVPKPRGWSLLRFIGYTPRQEAILTFVSKTLARSGLHRLALLAYAGVALAIPINSVLARAAMGWSRSWEQSFGFIAISAPLGLAVFALTGIRHVFSIPTELPANWLFRITEAEGRQEWMKAVERFVIVFGIAPVQLFTLPFQVAILGVRSAAVVCVLQWILMLVMFELVFQSWQKLPFTCSYQPGKRPLIAVLGAYLAVLGGAIPVLSLFIYGATVSTAGFVIEFAILVAAWIRVRKLRRDGWGESPLSYEDVAETVPDLGLRN